MSQSSSSVTATSSATSTPPSAAFLAGAEAARNAILVQNLKPAEVSRHMFTHVRDNSYRCLLCGLEKKSSNGFSNLMAHLNHSHALTWKNRMAQVIVFLTL